jgi:hypothetical protein
VAPPHQVGGGREPAEAGTDHHHAHGYFSRQAT